MSSPYKKPMKYNTLRIVVALILLAMIIGGSCVCAKSCSCSSSSTTTTTKVQHTYEPPPVSYSERQEEPSPSPKPKPKAVKRPSPKEMRTILENWLIEHPKNEGRTQWKDCIPGESFIATVGRFKDEDHFKWSSSDPTRWSMFWIDYNRDGINDEKWLLKDGRPAKRESLGPDGKTVVGEAQRF